MESVFSQGKCDLQEDTSQITQANWRASFFGFCMLRLCARLSMSARWQVPSRVQFGLICIKHQLGCHESRSRKRRRRRVKRHNQFWPLFLLYALLLTPCHQRKRPPHLRCHSSLSFALFIFKAICLAKNGKHASKYRCVVLINISSWKVEDIYVFFPFSFKAFYNAHYDFNLIFW